MVLISESCLTRPPNILMISCVYSCLFFVLTYMIHLLITHFTNQQTVGRVDGETAGEGVVYGESIHIGGLPVASPLVHIPTHVEVEGVTAMLGLLAHVF